MTVVYFVFPAWVPAIAVHWSPLRPQYSEGHLERPGLFVPVDTLAHPLFVRNPNWVSTYDSDPAQAVASRESILAMCVREHALVFGPHFPFPGLETIHAGYTGFSWRPIQ